MRIQTESRQPRGLSNHDDLGLLRILDTSYDGVRLERCVSDRQHRSELVRTLAVYLDSGGNYDHTSAVLIIHASTLRDRLSRIRDVSGRDLNDPESCLKLHIALRALAALHDNLGGADQSKPA